MSPSMSQDIKSIIEFYLWLLDKLKPVYADALGKVTAISDQAISQRDYLFPIVGAFAVMILIRFLIQVALDRSKLEQLPLVFLRLSLGQTLYPAICFASIYLTSVICNGILAQNSVVQFSEQFLRSFIPDQTQPNLFQIVTSGQNYDWLYVGTITGVALIYTFIILRIGIEFYIRSLFLQILFIFSAFVAIFVSTLEDIQTTFWNLWFDLLIRNIAFCIALKYVTTITAGLITPGQIDLGKLTLVTVQFALIPFAVNKAVVLFSSSVGFTPTNYSSRSVIGGIYNQTRNLMRS
jgi:hypothetical protein